MIHKYIFLVLATLVAIPQSSAQDSLEDMGLSKEHILDILRVCFSQNLDCKLLSRETDGTTEIVTLVGEHHSQDRDTYELGLQLFRHYPLVGQETGTMNFLVENAPEILTRAGKRYIRWQKNRLAYSFSLGVFDGFFADGTQTKLINLEQGFRSEISFEPAIKKIFAGICSMIAGSSIMVCHKILEDFIGDDHAWELKTVGQAMLLAGGGAIILGVREAEHVTKELEPYKISSIVQSEIRPRDEIMASNLLAALSNHQQTSIVGAMGAGHLYGVTRFLKAEGFIDHDLDLMNQYKSYMKDQETALLLRGTRLRKLSSLKHRSSFFNVEKQAKETYPEDFLSE